MELNSIWICLNNFIYKYLLSCRKPAKEVMTSRSPWEPRVQAPEVTQDHRPPYSESHTKKEGRWWSSHAWIHTIGVVWSKPSCLCWGCRRWTGVISRYSTHSNSSSCLGARAPTNTTINPERMARASTDSPPTGILTDDCTENDWKELVQIKTKVNDQYLTWFKLF